MDIPQEDLRELLHYNPVTGVLTWKPRKLKYCHSESSQRAWNTNNAGKRAGRVKTNEKGYQRRVVGLFGTSYLEHRVIWAYMKGYPIPEHVDHENRNATDNSWSNIRASNASMNGKNASMTPLNRSGVSGVCWSKNAGKWHAQCKLNGKMHFLGYFLEDDLDIAAMEVLEFRADNGFDPNHAREVAYYRQPAAQTMRPAP